MTSRRRDGSPRDDGEGGIEGPEAEVTRELEIGIVEGGTPSIFRWCHTCTGKQVQVLRASGFTVSVAIPE